MGNHKGLTMAELIVAIFILAVSISSVMMFFANARIAEQYARDSTVAASHGEYLLEEMRARTTLANITGTNWVNWTGTKGLNTLPSENISVAYTNSAADPLEITVNVNWTRNARGYIQSLLTRLTK